MTITPATPATPANEGLRLEALRNLDILDTPSETAFDSVTELASMHIGAPIALLSLVDECRQWFKSRVGLDAEETPRSVSFCAHAILTPSDPFIVEDALHDERFADNPLVTGPPYVGAYIGVPLLSPVDRLPLGTLCVIDTLPRTFSPDEIRTLRLLGSQVEYLLQARLDQQALTSTARLLMEANESLDTFTSVAAHDLKTPVRGIRTLVSFIREDHADVLAPAANELQRIDNRAKDLLVLVDDLLDYAQLPLDDVEPDVFDLAETLRTIADSLTMTNEIKVVISPASFAVHTRRVPLLTCVRNLIDNAIRHHPGPNGLVTVALDIRDATTIEISVTDDGAGIDPSHHERIFRPFESMSESAERKSTGLGLSAVCRLVERHHGYVTVESALGEGAVFLLLWPGQVVTESNVAEVPG